MKTNGNNTRVSDYYLGLDVGTESVGWAVTDLDYNILKFGKKSMWGVRLFDEASGSTERRTARIARRRLKRRKQRLELLEMLFNNEIANIDRNFFLRMKESSLYPDDKTETGKYALFSDKNFTDKQYLKKYPTIYHLRSELVHSDAPHDVRLVYLAIHHIMKNRGHFLFEGDSETGYSMKEELSKLSDLMKDFDSDLIITESERVETVLSCSNMGKTAKKKELIPLINVVTHGETQISGSGIAALLAGGVVSIADLFCDKQLKEAEITKLSLQADIEPMLETLSEALGDRAKLIIQLKSIFDLARLTQILNGKEYLSDAKIELYEKNKRDLKALKAFVKAQCPQLYPEIFHQRKDKLNNFAAYCGYKTKSGEHSCKQDDFCAFLKLKLADNFADLKTGDLEYLAKEIEDKTFLSKLTGTDNGVIPNQLHKKELRQILKNAEKYLPFLQRKDGTGKTVSDKILDIFSHKIPYYIGALNTASPNSWVIRKDEKIYPWNFADVVDIEKSAQAFIENLIGKCTYTGDAVLPLDSLLYSKFTVLNEINPLKINGKPIPVQLKQEIYNALFVGAKNRVTKKSVHDYLSSRGLIEKEDVISGIDDTVKSRLKSLHDLERILPKIENEQAAEDIIRSILIFGDDKRMLKQRLKRDYPQLNDGDIGYISRLSYKDWGRLSETFLTKIYSPGDNGVALSVMDMLWQTNCTLMELLSSDYQFSENAKTYRMEKYGLSENLDERLDEMYISPAVRRSIRQTLRIVDEIVDVKKSVPKKIFIEVARDRADDVKKQRTESRKNKLLALYKACRMDSGELFDRLSGEPDERLRSDKLYLYYTQFGRCMYTGEPISEDIFMNDNSQYDIDHIFPRSRIMDDSLDNRVLVKSTENRDKTNEYPIKGETRKNMFPMWKMLRDKNMISEKKFARLTRAEPLTDKELSDFVARQLVETQQSTKALATLLKELYPKECKIVYSKAGNVSRFRQEFDLIKNRNVNDFHHARDAYLNIVVGNVYDTKFTEKFFLNIRKETYSLNRVFDFAVPGAWKPGQTFNTVKEQYGKNTPIVTRMPREEKGALYDLQIMPAGKGQLPVKQGKSIARYGGYNKLKGSYFAVIEHTKAGKRIRTLEPVYLYAKDFFRKHPGDYCSRVLNLTEPVVIAPKIYFDSLIEIDGKRLMPTARTGDNIIYCHTYQLMIDECWEKYLKQVDKYVSRCEAARKEVDLGENGEITTKQNTDLYNWILCKLDSNVYSGLFKSMKRHMENGKEAFEKKKVLEQCRILLEAIKPLRCNSQFADFTELVNKGTVGRIALSKEITKNSGVFLINRSVTGLFESKMDLLK